MRFFGFRGFVEFCFGDNQSLRETNLLVFFLYFSRAQTSFFLALFSRQKSAQKCAAIGVTLRAGISQRQVSRAELARIRGFAPLRAQTAARVVFAFTCNVSISLTPEMRGLKTKTAGKKLQNFVFLESGFLELNKKTKKSLLLF